MTSHEIETGNNLYQQFDIPGSWLHPVSGLFFPLNLAWKRVAVNLSGGADSACGTMILAQLIQQKNLDIKIDVVTNIRNWSSRPWQGPIATNVLKKIKQRFPKIIENKYECYIPPEIEQAAIGEPLKDKDGNVILGGNSCDKVITDSFNIYLGQREKLDASYGFVTSNPPLEELQNETIRPRDRDVHSVKEWNYCPQFFRRDPPGRGWMAQPFMFVDKRWVLQQYAKNDWWDVFEATRSCEGDSHLWPEFADQFPDFENLDTNHPHPPTCQELAQKSGDEDRRCYWCQERAWARSYINRGN